MVAEDNVAQGLDLISTAESTLNILENRVTRLRDLQEQASNGTYGADSLKAINSECNALIDEINRLYGTTQYNGINLFMEAEEDENGEQVVKQESFADTSTTFKELGISNTTFDIKSSDGTILQTYDVEESDTIGDLFTTLQTEGFKTDISFGKITISSTDNKFITGELADKLGISTTAQEYVSSTTQGFDVEQEFDIKSYNTTTTETTVTQTLTSTNTTYETQTIATTRTETTYVTNTISTTKEETTQQTITVTTTREETTVTTETISTTTITPTETYTTTYVSQTEALMVTQRNTTPVTVVESMRVSKVSSFTSGQTYFITTTEDLQALATLVNSGNNGRGSYFELANDLDLSSISNWTPIGFYDDSGNLWQFEGVFDGNGYVISNLTINAQIRYVTIGNTVTVLPCDNIGLFGRIVKSQISDLGLENVDVRQVNGDNNIENVGGLVGLVTASTITDCYVTGKIEGKMSAGGLVGNVQNGVITGSYASVVVQCSSGGGLVGSYWGGGAYTQCTYKTVMSGKIETITEYIGGTSPSSMTDCYAIGDVISDYYGSRGCGGLIGAIEGIGTISRCYANCDVTGGYGSGGFIGIAGNEADMFADTMTITNCYAIGTADDAGFIDRGYFISNSCYSTQADDVAIQKTKAQIQTLYSSMGFSEANGWVIVDGQPLLSWQDEAQPLVTVTTATTLADLGYTTNVSLTLPSSTQSFAKTATLQDIIDGALADPLVTNAELVNGVLLITTVNNALELSSGFMASHSATQSSTTATVHGTTTTPIEYTTEKEVTTTVPWEYTTTQTSTTTVPWEYETVTTNTTEVDYSYETVIANTTTSQSTVTTTTTTTVTQTIISTVTRTLNGDTTFGDLDMSLSLKVTVFSEGTKSVLNITKDTTFDDFYSMLENKGITVSESGGAMTLTGSGDTYIKSNNIADLLNFGALSKTNATRTLNTKSDEQVYYKVLRGIYAPGKVNLQIGLNADSNSQIEVDLSFKLGAVNGLRNIGLDTNTDYLTQIDSVLADIREKQTHFGAVSNRLESALDEISIQYENLVSSRSTIRDADIAEVSSTYIQQQILQQASATLLATANQSPAIALQLI